MKNQIEWKTLTVSVAISLGVGIIGSILAGDMRVAYSAMEKPPLSPHGCFFCGT